MGSICNKHDINEEDTQAIEPIIKNSCLYTIKLGKFTQLNIIHGNQRQHRGQALVLITSKQKYQHCQGIRQFCPEADRVMKTIAVGKKNIIKSVCYARQKLRVPQFKTILVCILPQYKSENSFNYQFEANNIFREIIQNYNQFVIPINSTHQGINSMPNQLIIQLLLYQLLQRQQHLNFRSSDITKVTILSPQINIINIIKYQILKTQKYQFINNEDKETVYESF